MDEVELERVRQKVEAGEALSAPEFSLLEKAARSRQGPAFRLAVAHAWMNAGDDRRAVRLLESMQRDFPREVQVWLAHARALVSLERYGPAESSLEQALRVNPGDPEAQKVLAVVALRRGEVGRARALVDEVLRVDPADGEARLLKAELDASPRPAQKAPKGEFVAALLAQLRSQSTPHLLQEGELLVRLGQGGVGRLDLASLYAGYLEEGHALQPAVEAVASELAERALGVPEGREALLERVSPVLRDSAFLERAVGAARREGPAGLVVLYVLDDSALVRYLPEGALRDHGVTLDEVDAAAWRNLAERLAEPRSVALEGGSLRLSSDRTGLWALCEGDGHDAARLLVPAQQAALEEAVGAGPYRAFLGLRELALVCPEADAASVAALGSAAPAADGIGGQFRLETAGRLTRG